MASAFNPTDWDRRHNPLFMEWHAKHVHGAKAPEDAYRRSIEAERGRQGSALRQESEAKYRCLDLYSFAIPCLKILKEIAERGPDGILEVGAGSGYWSRLLSLLPADVVAVDRGQKENPYFGKLWHPVVERDGREVVRDPAHAKRTLLLCWPDESWAPECLRLSTCGTLAYVGAKDCAGTGGDALAAEIRDQWRPVSTKQMPNWYGESTRLEIYRRRFS